MSRLDHVYDLGSFGEVFTPNEAAATSSEVAPTFAYSSMAKSNANHDPAREPTRERPVLAGFAGRPTHTRGVIFQAAQIEKGVVESPSDYKGRYRRWPGLLLMALIVCGAIAAITYFVIDARTSVDARTSLYAQRHNETNSSSSSSRSSGSTATDDDSGSTDGPKSYPTRTCELPDYQSKNGQIVAVSKNGTKVPIGIKGINWFGMETGVSIPLGLWDNEANGTTAYQVAKFLEANNFNAVRLPVMISAIIKNTPPSAGLVNAFENQAINITSYMTTLQSIVKALAYRNIGVLISLHTLTDAKSNGLWYDDDVSEDDFLGAVDTLTDNLCTTEYWNIMGLDLKNEPFTSTWGDDSDTDFRAGAKRIAGRMLTGCPQWMGFVEGIATTHSVAIDGESFDYYDWYGGGLQGAKTKGLEFSVQNKVVWAPHYYTPAVYPQTYFYGGGTRGSDNTIADYVELDDATLKTRIQATMDDMFGFLASDSGSALLLGEFGGLYAKDSHPMKTTKRITDFTIEIIKQTGYSGGFVWSLNPESAYQYNPADKAGTFIEGVLQDDWLDANTEFLQGLAALDDLPNLQPFPCF